VYADCAIGHDPYPQGYELILVVEAATPTVCRNSASCGTAYGSGGRGYHCHISYRLIRDSVAVGRGGAFSFYIEFL